MGQRIPEKEIANFQLGYKIGFINDAEIWLLMLKKRNTSVIYIMRMK